MVSPQLQVAVDVGCRRHRVAVGNVAGAVLEEFDVEHNAAGLAEFFARIERLRAERGWPVAVAMEGYNGWARPLDRQVQLARVALVQRQQPQAGPLQGDLSRALQE